MLEDPLWSGSSPLEWGRVGRGFALGQLGNITGSQSWGIGQVRHPGWHLYFKGGWGIADGTPTAATAVWSITR